MTVRGLNPAEAAHVRLHAIEVKHAQAVVPAPRKQARPTVVHIQRRDDLSLACVKAPTAAECA